MAAQTSPNSAILPGDAIQPLTLHPKPNAPNPSLGAGLHVMGTQLHASTAGLLTKDAPSHVSIAPLAPRPALPYVNATVLARVTRLTTRQAHVHILAVDDVPCTHSGDSESGFGAIIRVQDVRATEKDKVVVAESFGVGDVVRAVVVSIGDERNYYLSTARNELGVVMARGEDGGVMYPVSWREVVDGRGVRFARKVARPEG